MKITRFCDASGVTGYGSVQADGSVLSREGSLYGGGSKTLLPGTIILTGTPHGVGFARKPQIFLKEGDTITIEIDGIGTLTNPILNEQP